MAPYIQLIALIGARLHRRLDSLQPCREVGCDDLARVAGYQHATIAVADRGGESLGRFLATLSIEGHTPAIVQRDACLPQPIRPYADRALTVAAMLARHRALPLSPLDSRSLLTIAHAGLSHRISIVAGTFSDEGSAPCVSSTYRCVLALRRAAVTSILCGQCARN